MVKARLGLGLTPAGCALAEGRPADESVRPRRVPLAAKCAVQERRRDGQQRFDVGEQDRNVVGADAPGRDCFYRAHNQTRDTGRVLRRVMLVTDEDKRQAIPGGGEMCIAPNPAEL